MQAFCNPLHYKKCFHYATLFLYFKIFSTSTSHTIHYESQEASLCVLQVCGANMSQRLLTLPGRVPKIIVFFLQTLWSQNLGGQKFQKKYPLISILISLHPMVEVLKKDSLFHCPSLVSVEVVFECFWKSIVKEL
jgi:hypothetical protein